MPSQFRRFGEKFKQALNINSGSSRDWKPTSNARNLAMIEETRAFAVHLKLLQRDLGKMEHEVEGALTTMRSVLAARLPRVFDETGAGVAPVSAEDHIVGHCVNQEAIASASAEMKQRLQDEVVFPLQQWLAAYRSIKASNKKVEQVRLDLDMKRRETLSLQERHARLQGRNDKDADAILYKAQAEEDKMNRLAARYNEMEAEVFNALLTLISDTSVLRDYQAAALAIVQRAFTAAYTAFDLSASVPMPVLPAYAPHDPAAAGLQPGTASSGAQGTQASYEGSNPAPPYQAHMYHQAPGAPQGMPLYQQPSTGPAQAAGRFGSPTGIAPMAASPPLPGADAGAGGAPQWFMEAKRNARAEGHYADSEDGMYAPSAPPMPM